MIDKIKEKPLPFIIATTAIILVVCLLTLLFYREYDSRNYKNQVGIQGINDYLKDQSDNNTANIIRSNLYSALKYSNNSDDVIKNIQDAKVRNGSLVKTYSEKYKIYTISFIIDIESLGQSYKAQYEWSDNEEAEYSEWGTNVSCPDKKDLIYGDFDCWDVFYYLAGSNDPIIKLLPYYDPDGGFIILPSNTSLNNIEVFIYSCLEEEQEKEKAKILDWFNNNDLDQNSYTFDYKNNCS